MNWAQCYSAPARMALTRRTNVVKNFLKSWKDELILTGFMSFIMGCYLLPWFKPEWFQ